MEKKIYLKANKKKHLKILQSWPSLEDIHIGNNKIAIKENRSKLVKAGSKSFDIDETKMEFLLHMVIITQSNYDGSELLRRQREAKEDATELQKKEQSDENELNSKNCFSCFARFVLSLV